ncbi:MAG: HAMP domain-containing histidine kinase [Alphaproteobacteria bacterium]|nr:HAMP domain-containing histidine kinase [Alphaproteobacteria bacterium]
MTAAIHRLSGEFVDPVDEAAFLEATHAHRLLRTRLVYALGAVTWLLFLVSDLTIADPATRALCAGLRVVAVLPGLGLLVLRTPGPTTLQTSAGLSVAAWFAVQGVLDLVHPHTDDRLLVAMAGLASVNVLCTVHSFRWLVGSTLLLVLPLVPLWATATQADDAAIVSAVLLSAAMIAASLYFHGTFNTVMRQRQRALWQVEAQVGARERLLSALAHELRTPMAKARMRVALAQDAPQRREEHLTRIDADLEHLTDLVDGVFRLGKLDESARTSVREPVSCRALVRAAAESLGGLSPDVEVEVGDLPPTPLLVDHQLLRAALQSLGSNAVRHARGHVRLEAHPVDQGMAFDVSDDGPGVPAEDRERIFDPFVQAGAEGEAGHLGLGLAIARRIAEAHGGTLTVDDGPLGGARFRLVVATG